MFTKELLLGKAGVVTGGDAGVGRAIAIAAAEHGADLVLAGATEAGLAEACEAVEARGRRCVCMTADIHDPEQAERLVRACADQLGRLDFLVNAADTTFLADSLDTSEGDFRNVVDTVLSGAFYCSRAAARVMRERDGGRIVSVGGLEGWNGAPKMAQNGAARAAVASMTRTLAVEWAPYGVLVNDVAAGPVDTEGARRHLWPDSETQEALARRVPLDRMAQASDITGPVLFLLSDAAAFVTGVTLYVDGGNRFWNG